MALTGLGLWLSNRYSSYATPLGWTETVYGYIVADTLEMLGVVSEAESTTIKLHAVGAYALLRQAKRDITFIANKLSVDGGSYDFNLESKIDNDLVAAFSEASPYLDEDQSISVDWGDNKSPYTWDEDRYNAGNI
jgi:hypothetical protein